MRQLILAGLLSATALALPATAPGPAAAQDLAPVVIVNDSAITRYDIEQRLRFMQALRAPGASAAAAEKALIDERLQIDEGRRMGINPSGSDIQTGMNEFASRGGLDAASLTGQLAQAGVDARTFRDFVTAGLIWREVLKQRVAPSVQVTDRDTTQARQRAIAQPRVTDVLISEIIMPAPQGSEARVLARAEELSRTISSEGAFAAAARRWSATPSAGSGGRLPWTPIARLPQGLAPILMQLKPGQVTQPLTIPGAVVLFMLRDTRGVQRPGLKGETITYLRLPVASVAEAQAVQARADTCPMLYVAAQGRPVQEQTASTGAIPADIAGVLARLDPDESAVLNRGASAEVVMLCTRQSSLLADVDGTEDLSTRPVPGLPRSPVAGGAQAVAVPPPPPEGATAAAGADPNAGFDPVPTISEARQAVFDRKLSQASDALLAELRANAIIRRR